MVSEKHQKELKAGIVIPTFNRTDYLKEALGSVLNQSHGNLEIVVVDNGSNNETQLMISSIGDPRVRYILNEENLGMIESINIGIESISNDVQWMAILCDDDLFDKDFIRQSLVTVKMHSAKSIVHGHRIFIDSAGKTIREASHSPTEESAYSYLFNRSKSRRETYLTGFFFKRKRALEIGGYPHFPTGLTTDDAFVFALSLNDKMFYANEAISYIRIHSEAESQSYQGISNAIKTLNEFSNYCLQKSGESSIWNDDDTKKLRITLNKYTKSLGTGWWLRNLGHFLDNYNQESEKSISELCSVVREKDARFPLIIKSLASILKKLSFYAAFREFIRKMIYLNRHFGIGKKRRDLSHL